MRMVVRVLVTVVLSVSAADVALAQRTTATLGGVVTDTAGGVLPGALAELTNEGTGAVASQVSDGRGEFLFNFVPVGSYTLRISLQGFSTLEATNIAIGAAQNLRRTYALGVSGVEETLTVTGGISLVNTVSAEHRQQLEASVIEAMPLANRNISGILDMAPGVTKQDANEGSNATRLRLNGLGGSSLRVAADGTDASGNAGSPSLSNYQGFNKIDVMGMEAVGESQIVKGVLPAEYGLAMAGFLNVMTKSGTNQFHGSTVYRFDDSAMTARDPFLGTSPKSTWHQFGGSLGGPLKTNRAFFFAAIESYRQTTFTSHNLQVPTREFRQQMLAALPVQETQLFLEPYPLPNQPYAPGALLGGFLGTGNKRATDDHFNSRLSLNVGGGSLSTIITLAHPYLSTPNAQPTNYRTYESTTRRIAATYVVGRGAWTAETRFGYNKNELFRIDSFNNVKDPNREELTPYGRRVPFISFPGIPGLAREIQSRGAAPTLSFEQQLAVVKGQHALKFGGIYFRPAGSRPGEESPTVSFNSLSDLLANDPSQIAITFTLNDFRYHAEHFGFFVQDDWRVTPALVINLGLRYDYYGHYVAVPVDPANPAGLYNLDRLDANRHHDENFNFGPLRDPLKPLESNPVNFGPRVGFAYNPDREGSTVFRGGIGLMTQPLDQQIFENQTGNTSTVPNRTTYTRLEARSLGLNWPVYNEDVLRLVQAQSSGRVFVGGLFDPKMKSPSALAMSFDVQRALGPSTVVQTGYLGTRGYNFSMARQYNEVDRLTGLRRNTNLAQGIYWDSSQRTTFHSWQSSLYQRLTRNLSTNVNYTWGKAMAHTGGDISPGFIGDSTANVQDFFNIDAEWGPASGDIRHNFLANWTYRVAPEWFASSVARHLLGGWDVAGIVRARSGAPIEITQTSSRTSRPDLVGSVSDALNGECCRPGSLQYLNPAAFRLVPINTLSGAAIRPGTIGHNALRGPGYVVLDLSIGKDVSLPGARADLSVRADILNALNRTNYGGVRTNLSVANFGQVFSTAGTPRKVQFQARLTF
ncbi:MAG: TonB-dependent receptor plug [Chloroflexi bacterium]|nr:TonB-dependent receptor plug [Chloroflexota bacterium]